MYRLNVGRLKTYVLITLIISSLILCGGLWFDDYHGFSTFFAKISKLISFGKDDIESKNEKIFIPSNIIVNSGDEAAHWILYPTGEKYEKFWKISKAVLKDISVTDKGQKFDCAEKAEWDSLYTKRSIIIAFNYPLNPEIMSLFFKVDKKRIKEETANIEEMILTKLGNNTMFYIKRKKDNEYVYQKYDLLNTNIFNDADFDEISNDETLIEYTTLRETNLNLTYSDNAFGPMLNFSTKRRVSLNKVMFKPEIIIRREEEINDLTKMFFGGGEYTYFIKRDGTHIFIDEKNNTLRVYSDGLIEFESSDSDLISNEDVDFENALRAAITATERYYGINSLYLTDIQESKGKFTFKFNYTINGIPVVCSRPGREPPMDSAAEVVVSKGQLTYKRFVSQYNVLQEEYKLSSDHDSIIDEVFMKDIIKEKINIEEIKLVYEDNGKNRDGILPTWLVKYNSGISYRKYFSCIKNKR